MSFLGKNFRTKLSTQFAAFTTMLIAITVFCIAWYSIATVNNLATQITAQSKDLNDSISITLFQRLGELISAEDYKELDSAAQKMVDSNIVATVVVKDKATKKVILHTQPSEKLREVFKENKISDKALRKKGKTLDDAIYKQSVTKDGKLIELGFYNEPITMLYLDMLRDNMLAMVFIFIFLGFFLSNLISGILIKPINILIKSLGDFAKGNFSHRLEEIMEIGDHVTILRDGKYVDDAAVKDIDVPWIVQKMTGSNKSYPKKERDIDWEKQDTVLEVKDLCLPKKGGGWLLDHVSFKLKRGEILGIYGLMGAGRTEVFECLMGLHPEHTGEVYVDGKKIKIKNIAEQIKNGFALVPEDRQAEGLVQTLDIEKNISLSSLKTCCNKFVLSKQKEDEYVDAQIKDIHIKVADKHLPILSLSGGNQQKCVIGKGVLTDPKILLMDEPSRGIDIGAKTEVFDIINQYADRGLSIICVSSELKEMLAIANRVVVLSNGIKTAEFADDEITEDNLVLASYKGHH